LARSEDEMQQELAELILQVQSKNQSLFTETLHRVQTTRSFDAERVRELESENATLRAQLDKLSARHTSTTTATNVASTTTATASDDASDLHALQLRLQGVKEQLAANERVFLQRQSELNARDEAAAVLGARIAQLELELRETCAARNIAEDALARERAGAAALSAAAEQRIQLANAAAERAKREAQVAKEREVRDLEESTRRRVETIQAQSEARWREAEAECERLRENLRRAERQALSEQQAMLALDSAPYDNTMMSSGSHDRDNNADSPDWAVQRAKSVEEQRAGVFPLANDAAVEERWQRVYNTIGKLNSELQ